MTSLGPPYLPSKQEAESNRSWEQQLNLETFIITIQKQSLWLRLMKSSSSHQQRKFLPRGIVQWGKCHKDRTKAAAARWTSIIHSLEFNSRMRILSWRSQRIMQNSSILSSQDTCPLSSQKAVVLRWIIHLDQRCISPLIKTTRIRETSTGSIASRWTSQLNRFKIWSRVPSTNVMTKRIGWETHSKRRA